MGPKISMILFLVLMGCMVAWASPVESTSPRKVRDIDPSFGEEKKEPTIPLVERDISSSSSEEKKAPTTPLVKRDISSEESSEEKTSSSSSTGTTLATPVKASVVNKRQAPTYKPPQSLLQGAPTGTTTSYGTRITPASKIGQNVHRRDTESDESPESDENL